MDESKGRKEFRRGKKNWTLTFSIVLLNNEKFYWTKYFRFTNKFFFKVLRNLRTQKPSSSIFFLVFVFILWRYW